MDLDLRGLRRYRNLTLEATGILSDRDPATISRLERGLIAQPRPETVVRLARALGISARRCRDLIEEAGAGDGELEKLSSV